MFKSNREIDLNWSVLVLWCSGYHICLTRRRSPVRNRAAPYNFMAQTGREKMAICAVKFCDLTTALGLFTNGSCGVVVITCASHAQGPRFDPGQEHVLLLRTCLQEKSSPHLLNRELHLLPRGLVVRIRCSHRRGRGSIPRLGMTFTDTVLCTRNPTGHTKAFSYKLTYIV